MFQYENNKSGLLLSLLSGFREEDEKVCKTEELCSIFIEIHVTELQFLCFSNLHAICVYMRRLFPCLARFNGVQYVAVVFWAPGDKNWARNWGLKSWMSCLNIILISTNMQLMRDIRFIIIYFVNVFRHVLSITCWIYYSLNSCLQYIIQNIFQDIWIISDHHAV